MDFEKAQEEIEEMAKAFGEEDFESQLDDDSDDKSTDVPTTDIPETEDDSEDDKDKKDEPEVNPYKKELDDLRKELEDLKKSKSPSTDAPTTEAPVEEEEDKDFLDGVSLEDLNESKFNEILNRVYKEGVKSGKTFSRQEIDQLKVSIPEITEQSKAVQEELKSINDKFYSENKDLTKWKPAVGMVFAELSAANPEKSYKELLPKVAEEVRNRIGIKKSNKEDDDELPPPPKRGKRSQRKSSEQKPSEIESEIDAMNDVLDS
jgi:hypothetical protein